MRPIPRARRPLTHSLTPNLRGPESYAKPYNAESLHVHIYRLRNKLTPFGMRIETMVNVGYRLLPAAESPRPPREAAPAPARQSRA